MSTIYLIRHGETEWNKAGRAQGRSNDISLSYEGKMQAEALSRKLKNHNIDLFFSSQLARAYETAKIISREHDKDVNACHEFSEINFGDFEGLDFGEIKERYGEIFSVWRSTPHLARIPNGESLMEIKERSMSKLLNIVGENADKNILIVSHGITIKVMIASMMGIDLGNIHKIRQDNTSLNIFEYNFNSFSLKVINDTCHASLREDNI